MTLTFGQEMAVIVRPIRHASASSASQIISRCRADRATQGTSRDEHTDLYGRTGTADDGQRHHRGRYADQYCRRRLTTPALLSRVSLFTLGADDAIDAYRAESLYTLGSQFSRGGYTLTVRDTVASLTYPGNAQAPQVGNVVQVLDTATNILAAADNPIIRGAHTISFDRQLHADPGTTSASGELAQLHGFRHDHYAGGYRGKSAGRNARHDETGAAGLRSRRQFHRVRGRRRHLVGAAGLHHQLRHHADHFRFARQHEPASRCRILDWRRCQASRCRSATREQPDQWHHDPGNAASAPSPTFRSCQPQARP